MASLEHETALVTVASRRAGRGIALALATAGATVYLSGRTVESAVLPEREALSGRPSRSPTPAATRYRSDPTPSVIQEAKG